MDEKEFKKFKSKSRLHSVKYALNGLKIIITEETNSRIHTIITIVVIAAGFMLKISPIEWLTICVLIALVFGLEIMNTAIENLCDHVSPEWSEAVKRIKDIAAASVFIASFISVICGAIIFLPRICDLFT